jgi:hypothetical protein
MLMTDPDTDTKPTTENNTAVTFERMELRHERSEISAVRAVLGRLEICDPRAAVKTGTPDEAKS